MTEVLGVPELETDLEGAEPEPDTEPEPELDDDDADDDEGTDDDEPDEPEAAAPAGPSEADIERAFKALERRAKTYRGSMAGIIEESGAPFVPCAVCSDGLPGFFIDPRVEPLSAVAEQAMRALLGIGQEPPYVQDQGADECPACEGWGRTRTGSKVDQKRLITCKRCRGAGWIGPAADLLPGEVAELPNMAGEYVAPDNEPAPDVDAWNTPRSHPEFGISPQYREPGWQERIDAYTAGEPAPIS